MLPLSPDKFAEHYQKARSLHMSGRLAEARAIYVTLTDRTSGRFEPFFQLAGIAWKEGDLEEALAHLRDARALNPDEPTVLRALADVQFARGETAEAIEIHEELIRMKPKDAGLRIDKAFKLQRVGEFVAAEEELWRALKLDPARGEPYRMLARNRKLRPGDPLIGKMRKALSNPRLSPAAKVQIEFAMAKAMEDTGKYDQVFRYLRPANAAMKKQYRYDIRTRLAEVDGLIAAFKGYDFTTAGAPDTDFSPIFVTGLPRSGTTLVERILASHSQVEAGGEMPYALRLSLALLDDKKNGFRPISTLSTEEISKLGQDYEHAVRQSRPFGRIITDKAIQPHLVMGLLRLAIPGARFVVVRRDPRDGLYSIYKNMFAQGMHRYAYDLKDLAIYYASFLKMLDFWREAMPGGFHELHYEELVADPESQTRALISAAVLGWEEACLRPHDSGGAVRTLSMQQVREPIYRSSSAIWRRYETDLAPLIDALKEEGVLPDGAE